MRRAALLFVLAVAACGGRGTLSGRETHRVAYPNGYARFEFELRDGLPNGRGRTWYPTGALQSEGSYSDGARHGRFWFFTEDGAFDHQAMFFNNSEVWRSAEATDAPPSNWAAELPDLARPAQRVATRVEAAPVPAWAVRSVLPLPYFSNLDRTSALARGGMQLGVGDSADVSFGSVARFDAFANYRFSKLGVYGQLTQTQLELPSGMWLNGRRSLELGGTYLHTLRRIGDLSTRVGILVPTGNDDLDGFLASSAGAALRPSDAAASIPSSVALRTGSSFTRIRERVVLQADLGVDWLFGSDARGFDALLRANAGVGFGTRTAIVSFELDNTVSLSDATRRLHSLGLGGTVTFAQFWLSACASITPTGATALNTSVGHDL